MSNLSRKEVKVLEGELVKFKNKLLRIRTEIKKAIEAGNGAQVDGNQLPLFNVRMNAARVSMLDAERVLDEVCMIYSSLERAEEFSDVQNGIYESLQLEYEQLVLLQSVVSPPIQPPSSQAQGTAAPRASAMVSSARLPKISLPSFSGKNRADWLPFKDLYRSLVHDTPLSEIEKFHYLLSSLQEPALSLVNTLPLVAENYRVVWNKLLEKYDDRRLIATHYFENLLNLQPLSGRVTSSILEKFVNDVNENYTAFQKLNLQDKADFMMLVLTSRLLDGNTRTRFEAEVAEQGFPTFTHLIAFLRKQCKIREAAGLNQTSSPSATTTSSSIPRAAKPLKGSTTLLANFASTSSSTVGSSSPRPVRSPKGDTTLQLNSSSDSSQCVFCKRQHTLYKCSAFLEKSASDRYTFARSNRLCINCLQLGHFGANCTSKSTCKQCMKRHHTLLHFGPLHGRTSSSLSNVAVTANAIAQPASGSVHSPSTPHSSEAGASSQVVALTQTLPASAGNCTEGALSHLASGNSTVLLGTAVVRIRDAYGYLHDIRIIVDPGSNSSIITSRFANKLGLIKRPISVAISGLGQATLGGSKYKVNCTIISNFTENSFSTEALVMPTITANLPTTSLSPVVAEKFGSLTLADPQFWKSAPIDFLLGSDLYPEILDDTGIVPLKGEPCAVPSKLGWILLGKLSSGIPQTTTLFTSVVTETLEDSLKKFWEIEETSMSQAVDPQDVAAELHFAATHSRDESGRYIVELPFRSSPPNLKDDSNGALVRFKRLKARLYRDVELNKAYCHFMSEYRDLDHMEPATCFPNYIIPHHPVIKNNDPSTIRVVFDGSFAGSRGALNKHLLSGPALQLDISDIILNFRKHKIVFTTDIVKMYRQILVSPVHRAYQQIHWTFDSQLDTRFELKTVTYGLVSAPFLAMRVIKQLVSDDGERYPLASSVLSSSIYVDDVVTGSASVEDALVLKDELIDLLSKGGFTLKKWASNSKQFLDTIPEEHLQQSLCFDGNETSIKLLGLRWDPQLDIFSYTIVPIEATITKRAVLSVIARIYDPLGWIAPAVFYAKHILQLVWKSGQDWDQPLPPAIATLWHIFVEQLPLLSNIKIPRWLNLDRSSCVRLVGFCDASEKGYSACIYLVVCNNDVTTTHLLKAKTRLAPLKVVSIPRLELCAAHLLVKLLQSMHSFIASIPVVDIDLFSDSTVVLSWICSSPHTLNVFVANRVAFIQEITKLGQWHHVPSLSNPADCASRGITPVLLPDYKLWWNGPPWISLQPQEWPVKHAEEFRCSRPLESKKKNMTLHILTHLPRFFVTWISEFSSYSRLQRTMAFILRFIYNSRLTREQRQFGPLTHIELKRSVSVLVGFVQRRHFAVEYRSIQSNIVPKSLQKLSPFIDKEGIIRVGGRLSNSSLSEDVKHPILLPPDAHFTHILIDYYHRKYLHAQPHFLQSAISQLFWIISARRVVRKRIFTCLTCFRLKAQPATSLMGDLPESRVQLSRPFVKVGVDFAGPFKIKESTRRNAPITKAYLCLFVCMATKALHLEVVSSLSTEAFIASLNRFISRRGCPTDMYSDCGTNFVGAAREFVRYLSQSKEYNRLGDDIAPMGIQWHFNPPLAPHFGGLWEAGVKSSKGILLRVAGNRPFTFEELTTLFCRVEAMLNSRPLCPMSSELDDLSFLTPGHFLIGTSMITPPEPDLTSRQECSLSRWQLVNQASRHIWNRFSIEYLHTLQQRSKWTTQSDAVQKGALVLMIDPNSSPLEWKVARIMDTHPGTDGVVRVVTLQTAGGIFKRPLAKVAMLPASA